MALRLPTATSPVDPGRTSKRLRMLCLHSFRTSAAIFQQQFARAGLDKGLSDLVELDFIDAPHSASGAPFPDVRRFFEPPYFEWANAIREDDEGLLWRYMGAEESEEYIIKHMNDHGPYDGIIGFSQGALLSSAMLAMKQAGSPEAQDMPSLRLCIFIGAAKSRTQRHLDAFAEVGSKMQIPTCHILGEKDPLLPNGIELVQCFHSPQVIRHSRGHVVPALQGEQLQQLRSFIRAASMQPAL